VELHVVAGTEGRRGGQERDHGENCETRAHTLVFGPDEP
jgi:hypothetical protein